MSLRNGNSTVLKLLLSIGFLVALAATAHAREQWQIPRNEPPPTAPYGGGRSVNTQGANGYTTPGTAGNPLPGYTGGADGSGTPGMTGGTVPSGQLFPGTPVGSPGGTFQGTPSGGYDGMGTVPGLVAPGTPPTSPGILPPNLTGKGGVTPDFFKQFAGKRLTPGTVLTGVSETNLSSIKSKRGDVFSILLPHGYSNEGEELVPPNSKILGVVVDSAPAATQRLGMPGRLSIALKTIVFPDGRTSSINGFIDRNPAHDQLKEPKLRNSGINFGDYGQAVKGMLFSSVGGISWVTNKAMRGKEFVLSAGTPVSVKLNSMLDVAKMNNPAAALNGGQGVPGVPGLTPGAMPGVPGLQGNVPNIPGLTPGAVPGMPGYNQPGVPGLAPGAVPNFAQGGFPGSSAGAPPTFTQNGFPGGMPGTTASGIPGFPASVQGHSSSLPPLQGAQSTFFPGNLQNPNQLQSGNFSQGAQGSADSDPNSIFNTPLASPQTGTPDPF